MRKVKMANIKITELNSELMAGAIANAKARRNNSISEISEEQAAEVLGGMSLSQGSLSQGSLSHCVCPPTACPPIIIGVLVINPNPLQTVVNQSASYGELQM
ncbi:MAG: hypothetical protein F6K17_34965 [Okeania sp. SIO3C4]|nr:hypothetical protein [Okeania sp. SIO3B3]NER07399.1 hypothetical protein [Okeania sp. SIO3C4]